MQKIGPCLWFDGQAEEAARFYVSVFPNSRVLGITRYQEGMPRPAGSVLTVNFILDGEEFVALNGGPHFKFSPAISFIAHCQDQGEVDDLWRKLSDGGEEGQCGWVTDRYGVSWQVVPDPFLELLGSTDKAATQRALAAMMKMNKLDLAALLRAYEGAS